MQTIQKQNQKQRKTERIRKNETGKRKEALLLQRFLFRLCYETKGLNNYIMSENKETYFETFLNDPLRENIKKLEAAAEISHIVMNHFIVNGFLNDDDVLQDISCILEFTTLDILYKVKDQISQEGYKVEILKKMVDNLEKENADLRAKQEAQQS